MTSRTGGRTDSVSLFDDDGRGDQAVGRRSPGRSRPAAGSEPGGTEDERAVFAPPDLIPRVVRRWREILACGLVAALAGLAYGLLTPTEYRAEALVQLGTGSADLVTGTVSPQDDLDRRVATETEIIGSDRVRAAAEAAVDRDLPPVEVTQENASSLLSVAVTTTDPDDAAEDADAYSDAYLQLTSARTRDQLEPAIDVLNERQKRISQTLDDLQTLLAGTTLPESGTDPATDAVQARVDNLLEQRQATSENIDRLKGAAAIGNLDVRSFADAVAPSDPVSPSPARLALIGLVLGVVTASVVAAAVPVGLRRRRRG